MTNDILKDASVLVTGGAGIAGQAVGRLLVQAGARVRLADAVAPKEAVEGAEFMRCDTRTPEDARRAVQGMTAVIHLAAWHCAHQPPVSDPTIWAVNVDGTFHVFEACRAQGVKAIVYASSMAYGYGSVYSVSKVIGEDLCRAYHEMTGASIAMLRYHDFVPKPYLAFGAKLLRNGVDRRDVAEATVAATSAALAQRFKLFMTIVHTNHGMTREVIEDFRTQGPAWCETQLPGAKLLLDKYDIDLPERVEQHDLSEAARLLEWRPRIGFVQFLRDLQARDARSEDVRALWAPGQLPETH